MTTNFEPHECLIFLQSTKIGTHENKAILSILYLNWGMTLYWALQEGGVNTYHYTYTWVSLQSVVVDPQPLYL